MTRQMLSALLGLVGLGLVASCAILEGDEDDSNGDGEDTGGAAGGTGIQVGGTGARTTGGRSGSDGGADTSGTGGGAAAEQCDTLVGLGECGTQGTQAQQRQVNMLLVMDKSGSMEERPAGYETTLWEGLKTALAGALDTTEVKSSMSLGLLLYPDQAVALDCGGAEACCQLEAASGVDVPIGSGTDTVPQIIAKLDETLPGGGTPIAKALAKAYDYFSTGDGSTLGGDRYVLLATDGGPNCNGAITCGPEACTRNLENKCETAPNCCESQPTACVDDAEVIAQIDRLRSIDVGTFVVGIPGSEAYAAYLDSFAIAGGHAVTGATQSYYEVTASGGVAELTETFKSITIDLVKSCDINLQDRPADVDAVNVAVDCTVIKKGTDDDDGSSWAFNADYTMITIDGTACERIRTTGVRRIDAVFGCGTIY